MLSYCRVIGNLSLVEFLGGFSFSSYFSLVVITFWDGCLLLDILLGLSLYAYSRVYISRCDLVLAFSFIYIENTKNIHFTSWHLIFWVLIIDLDTCMETLQLIEIAELD
jgi:hypothetical protein